MLIIGTGKDTKKLSDISSSKKSYRAILKLGETTETLDNEAPIIDKKPVPDFDNIKIQKILSTFRGDYIQTPPMFSAKRVNGVRLYKLARKNITVTRETVKVEIMDIALNRYF